MLKNDAKKLCFPRTRCRGCFRAWSPQREGCLAMLFGHDQPPMAHGSKEKRTRVLQVSRPAGFRLGTPDGSNTSGIRRTFLKPNDLPSARKMKQTIAHHS